MHLWQRHESALEWENGGAEQLPTRAEQQEVLLTLLTDAEVGDGAVLDLGTGSGLVAEAVLDRLRDAQLVGVDFSPAMLDLARARLDHFGSRVRLLDHDLAEPASIELPDLPYKAVFSVQTLHHLSDPGKAAALAWAADIVDPGGLVVVIDQIAVDELLFRDWEVVWRRIDSKTPETYADYVDELAQGADRPARLQDHLAWMALGGLHACCLHLYGNRAVLVGRKPSG